MAFAQMAGQLHRRRQILRFEKILDDLDVAAVPAREPSSAHANGGDAVTLITVHSCKGLEFPHVRIVGLEDGGSPHARSKAEGTLDEERRLFYVAITRAMQTLTLSHCAARKKYGTISPCRPSPFLYEIPPELLESPDGQASQPVSVETDGGLFAAMRLAAGN